MKFPLNKSGIRFNHTEHVFLDNYKETTEIPLLPHPGAFSKVRKNHQHEGVDLYCEEGDEVIAMLDGVVIDIFPFTGEHIASPWWNNTWAILIETSKGVINYGELIPSNDLKIGQKVFEGQTIGYATKVLKKDKGRPMTMLHLEMYTNGTKKALSSWDLEMDRPSSLLNPTYFLIEAALENHLFSEKQVFNNVGKVNEEFKLKKIWMND